MPLDYIIILFLHAASSVSYGETFLLIISISLGTRFESMTGYIGGPDFK